MTDQKPAPAWHLGDVFAFYTAAQVAAWRTLSKAMITKYERVCGFDKK